MGWQCGRLILVLLCLSSISSYAASASFAECFPGDQLMRFWQDPSYISNNPNIITIWSIHSYSFAFDNSTESLGLENISIINGSTLLARVPVGQRTTFSEPAALLTRASDELALAKETKRASHTLSTNAQSAVRDNFGMPNIIFTNVFFLSALVQLDILLKVSEVSKFVSLYPAQYSASLEHAASAHDLLQSAALSISRLAQGEYEFLSRAGAGSQNYSGAASATFNYAESLLAPNGGFCENEASAYQKSYSYFASYPNLPDFTEAGFSARLKTLGGTGENSSVARTLSLYMLLFDAKSKMLGEYSTAQLYAQDSSRALSSEISLLGGEKLELIGDTSPSVSNGTDLIIGSGYTGIYSGYLNAKEDFSRAQSLSSSSQASFSSKEADGWLFQAISEAQASAETSDSAIASLKLVRSNAEAAVFNQRNAAQDAIAASRASTGASASSLASAQSLSSARSLLAQAEEAFASAGSLPSLGARYQAYTNALRVASSAYSLSQNQQSIGIISDAEQALSRYSALLSLARADGVDVAYEQETLSEYRSLLSSSKSIDIVSAVLSAVQSDQRALLVRIYETYSYVEEKYARALKISDEMREFAPSIFQQTSQLSRYFPSGTLEPNIAAGHIKQSERDLDSILQSCSQLAPQYLSSILSRNSHVSEIYEMPTLGKQTDYTAQITTINPSSLSSSGAIPFIARTAVPVYSSDFSSGDALSDAYPDKGKTAIIISSVSAFQSFSFTFMKKDQPAQIISSDDVCSFATDELASASRTISFISSRALPTLHISQSAPISSNTASVSYSGQKFPLSSFADGNEDTFQGEIGGVAAGKGELEISYSVSRPFTTSLSTYEYEALLLGTKKISYALSLSPASLKCSSATISIYEPYVGIANLSVIPLSGEKIVRASAVESGGETHLSLTFTPLTKGKAALFAVSYILSDTSQALTEALSQAELLVLTYNRTKDALMLAQARTLASEGKNNEALSILSQLRKEAQELSYSAGDYQIFLQEKSESVVMSSSLISIQNSLALSNSSSHAAFSSALFKYQSSLSSASDEAEAGGYQKAVSIIRKAKSDLSASLAALSLSSLKSASEKYAVSQKQGAGNSTLILSAQDELSSARAYYTQGEFAQSLLHSSMAISHIISIEQASSNGASEIAAQAESLRSDYAALRSVVEPLLANYSSQYAALTAQSRRQLPFTPSAAIARLSEADKQLAGSKKSSILPQDAFSQINSSYAKLSSLNASLGGALASLASSASSSLEVARAALTEVKSRASAAEAGQISDEVARAEDFMASAMYSDSLASSDRAIRAANTALSKSSAGGNPLQPIALAIISILFLAAAAYYFFAGKKRAQPEAKKEVPKAE